MHYTPAMRETQYDRVRTDSSQSLSITLKLELSTSTISAILDGWYEIVVAS